MTSELDTVEAMGGLGTILLKDDALAPSGGALQLLHVEFSTVWEKLFAHFEMEGVRTLRSMVQQEETGPPITVRGQVDGVRLHLEVRWQRREDGVLMMLRDITNEQRRRVVQDRLTRHLRLAEEAIELGHWSWDLRSGEVFWSDGIYRLFEQEPQAKGPSFEEALAPYLEPDRERLLARVDLAVSSGEPYDLKLRFSLREGHLDWMRATGRPTMDRDGNITGLFGTLQRITGHVRNDARMQILSEAVNSTTEGIVVTDADGRITWVNEGFCRRTGYSLEQALGQVPGRLLQGPRTDTSTVDEIRGCLRTLTSFEGEILNYTRTGEPYWTRLSIRPHLDGEGVHIGYVSVQFDVTEWRRQRSLRNKQQAEMKDFIFRLERQKAILEDVVREKDSLAKALQEQIIAKEALEKQLRGMALVDQLTGLPNRVAVLDRLRRESGRAGRYGEPLAVVLLDIDHFKRINDTWGHQAGDTVLRHVAEQLPTVLRDYDCCGRIGGEEFLVVLPRCSVSDARHTAERLRNLLHVRPCVLEDGCEVPVTASFGVAMLHPGEEVASLLSRADGALYEAKSAGRNTWRLAPELSLA